MAVTTVTEDLVSKLGDLSAADLVALKELLGVTAQPAAPVQPGKRWDPEANLPPDEPLAEPVRFWNARYPEYRLRIPGRSRAVQFWGGSFLAKTVRELTAARNAAFTREGDDLEKPRKCPHCQWPCWNEGAADDHIRHWHPTA
jgi:hypothetical protein